MQVDPFAGYSCRREPGRPSIDDIGIRNPVTPSGGAALRPIRAVALVIIIAAIFVVGTAAAWTALRRGDPAPERLTLGQLAFGQEDYDGRLVRTGGVVRRFGPEDGALRLHYVIEDGSLNRVRLAGGNPAGFVGRAVQVVGRFRFTETTGRTIDVEQIDAR